MISCLHLQMYIIIKKQYYSSHILQAQAAQNKNVCDAYEKMLGQYVMRSEDRVNLAEVNSSLKRIEAKLLKNPAWLECKLPKE